MLVSRGYYRYEDDGAYLPPTDVGLDLRFVHTDATGTRASWRAIEEFEGPDPFVETALVEQDEAWQRANVLTYVRSRDEEMRP